MLVDEVSANVQIFRAALRAKAKNPLTICKLVDLKRVRQDVSGGETAWNANDLVAEVREKYPDEFEQPVVMKPPEPPKPDTRDAFQMSAREFDDVWRIRWPWSQ